MTAPADTIKRLSFCSVEPCLGGVSLISLAELYQKKDHPANNRCSFPCSQGCGKWIEGTYFFSPVTACDECRAAAEQAERVERAKTYWEAICPPSFRETSKTHAGFPQAQYTAVGDWLGGDSLFFVGPSGKGKTRLAMLLLRRCLHHHNSHVGVMWPEQLKAVRNDRDTLAWIARWGKYDVLLMDDALIACASDSRCYEAFKDLLDYRMRFKRVNIVTSQIDSGDVKEQLGKFGKDTKADREIIEALLRRLRETCRIVSFAEATPAEGESNF